MSNRWYLYAELQEIAHKVLNDDSSVDDFARHLGELVGTFAAEESPKDHIMPRFFSALFQCLAKRAFLPDEGPWTKAVWQEVPITSDVVERFGPEVKKAMSMLSTIPDTGQAPLNLLEEVRSTIAVLRSAPHFAFWHSALLLLYYRLEAALETAVKHTNAPGALVCLYRPPAKMQSRSDRGGDHNQYDAFVGVSSSASVLKDYKARVLGFGVELRYSIPEDLSKFETELRICRTDLVDIEIKISNGTTPLIIAPVASDHLAGTHDKRDDGVSKSSSSLWRRLQGRLPGSRPGEVVRESIAEPWYLWDDDWRAFRCEIDITKKAERVNEKPGFRSRFLLKEKTEPDTPGDGREISSILFPTETDTVGLAIKVLYRDLFGPRWSDAVVIPIKLTQDEEVS